MVGPVDAGAGAHPACRDVVLPALSCTVGHRAEPPRPFASGEIGDVWGFAPKLLLHCCTRTRALLWGDLGALPGPEPPSQMATLAGSPWASPDHRDQPPCSPLAVPSPTGQHIRPVSSGGYSPPAPQKKGERLPNSTAPGS